MPTALSLAVVSSLVRLLSLDVLAELTRLNEFFNPISKCPTLLGHMVKVLVVATMFRLVSVAWIVPRWW